MDVALHQKTMKRQEIRSRAYPSLRQSWLLSAQRDLEGGGKIARKKVSENSFLVAPPVLCVRG